MRMSSKSPTKEGYYWYADGLTDWRPVIVRVERNGEELYVSNEEIGFSIGEDDGRTFWAGPIKEPTPLTDEQIAELDA